MAVLDAGGGVCSSLLLLIRQHLVFCPPVTADVREQVFRRGLVRAQAGDVEDGPGPGVPLAFLLVRGVPLGEQGLACAGEPGAGGAGADRGRGGVRSRSAGLAWCGPAPGWFPETRGPGVARET